MAHRFIALLFLIMASPFANAAPPNILFILADDLGYGDLGSYGNTFCDTPNIDRLAREGMRFTNAYASAPICSASRVGMLTGKTPARLGFEFVTKHDDDYAPTWARRFADKQLIPPVYTLNLPLAEQTIAETLNPLGYATGITGKWHVSSHYQRYLGWSPTHGPQAQGFQWSQEGFGAHPYSYDKKERGTYGDYAPGEFPADSLTNSAIDFMKLHPSRPFFLLVSHYYVHLPMGTKCQWLRDKYAARASGNYSERRAEYGAFVETLDHYVGQLLDALNVQGLADNTLVIFASDNGGHPEFAFNAPLRGSKWNLYEGNIRVPFIARWPKVIPPGTTSDVPLSNTDLHPTFAELAGNRTELPTPMDGTSIAPLLRGEKTTALNERSFYWHFPYYHPEKRYDERPATIGVEDGYVSQTRPQSAIRKGRYKLIYFWEEEQAELYDLESDPGESQNLAKLMPEKATSLKAELLGYLDAAGARLPQRTL